MFMFAMYIYIYVCVWKFDADKERGMHIEEVLPVCDQKLCLLSIFVLCVRTSGL